MRIVIDFHDYLAQPSPELLAACRRLVLEARSANEVWAAVPLANTGFFDGLIQLLQEMLPRDRIRAYALPGPGAWSEQACEPVRRHFLDSLAADCVVTPEVGDSWERLATRLACGGRITPVPVHSATRPCLAFVSPLPPLQTGIAFYSADLLPELARYYDITLVVDQPAVDDERLKAFPAHSLDWFEANAQRFDRIVYQFGNSLAHRHMFDLIRRHPGLAVMHDLFLSNVLDEIEHLGSMPPAWLHAMYESHGYAGLRDLARIGRESAIWKYPASRAIFEHATGVVVHSGFARQLARDWYGPDAAARCTVVPLPRAIPQHAPSREAARARLGLAPDDFVVGSFGLLGRTKLNHEVLEAFVHSGLAADPHCTLVFVGKNVPNAYGSELLAKIRAVRPARIRITEFVTASEYEDWLVAADVAVQLRSLTRGETSAAVLDCMAAGLPTVVNDHGSAADVPEGTVLSIDDPVSIQQLADAMRVLRSDIARRRAIGDAAAAHVRTYHTIAHAAVLYRDRIESAATAVRHVRYKATLRELARIEPAPSAEELALTATAIAFNRGPSLPQRQLLVDVSALVQVDLGTGIQRVVRSLLRSWMGRPPGDCRLEPVFSAGGGQPYRYARAYGAALAGVPQLRLEDAPAELRPGDIFLGLDLHPKVTRENAEALRAMRRRGVQVFFAVYDLLPLRMPHAFPPGESGRFREYLETITSVADGIACISHATAQDLLDWLNHHPPERSDPLGVGFFHMGADIASERKDTGRHDLQPSTRVLASIEQRPTILMVGTIEPRKGHSQALDAVEQLWSRGEDLNLVVLGKAGWHVDELTRRMERHRENGRRLFWLGQAPDAVLRKVYERSSALLAPSLGEGFGLPLIEAAQHGLAIIARDLPVFREVAGEHAHYFTATDAPGLARTLSDWLASWRSGRHVRSDGLRWLSWDDSAAQLECLLFNRQWIALWKPDQAAAVVEQTSSR